MSKRIRRLLAREMDVARLWLTHCRIRREPLPKEIIPLFTQRFTGEHCIDYGGSISTPVLDNIVSNCCMEDPQSLRWFKLILDVDHRIRKANLVPTINVVMAGRARTIAGQPVHPPSHSATSRNRRDTGAAPNA